MSHDDHEDTDGRHRLCWVYHLRIPHVYIARTVNVLKDCMDDIRGHEAKLFE